MQRLLLISCDTTSTFERVVYSGVQLGNTATFTLHRRTRVLATKSSQNSVSNAGWSAHLDLEFVDLDARTRLRRRAAEGPLAVQKPFYPEDACCHVYLLHPPGGIVGGDSLVLDLDLQPGAHALLTAPGAAKFYRSSGAAAKVSQRFRVAEGAILEWLPTETLVFDSANAKVETTVDLAGGGRYLASECIALGRPAADAPFSQGQFESRVNLWRTEASARRLVFRDRLVLDAGTSLHGARWGLDSATVLGSFIAAPIDKKMLEALRKALPEHVYLTLKDDVLLGRILGDAVEPVQQTLRAIWQALRPALVGKPAVAPRIWAT